jgi:hypothetical protein
MSPRPRKPKLRPGRITNSSQTERYDPATDWLKPTARQNANNFLFWPSRVGNTLHYRNGTKKQTTHGVKP